MKQLNSRFNSFLSVMALLTVAMFLLAACGADPTPTPKPASPAPAAAPKAESPAAPEVLPTATPKPAAPAAPKATPVPADPLFEGKSIRIIVGFSPGGGFDTFARFISRHLPRFLPGEPSVIVQNRPGAGSLVAANTVYALDNTKGVVSIAAFNYAVNSMPVLGDPAAKYDPAKYQWLADMSYNDPTLIYIGKDATIRSMEDWANTPADKPLIFASTGPGSGSHTNPLFMNWAGFPTKVISGYSGSSDAMLAMFRGEVDARTNTLGSSLSAYSDQIEEGLMSPLASFNLQNPDIGDYGDVPYLGEYMDAGEETDMFNFIQALGSHLRVYAAPPSTPKPMVDAFRKGWSEMVKDPKFNEEASKAGVAYSYFAGVDLQKDIETLSSASPAVKAQYLKWLTGEE
jgi:tripartite-type tricarboxylate transporter receptor subunit TctC